MPQPEPFNFEAFIAGTQLARRTVSVYRIDHRDEILRLTEEHKHAVETPADERVATRSAQSDTAKRIEQLRDEMEASRTDFVLRTLTPDEYKANQEPGTDVFDQIATQSVDPHLTADQWRSVAAAIGVSQWATLVNDANDLILSKVAVPDFSRTDSATRSTPTSS